LHICKLSAEENTQPQQSAMRWGRANINGRAKTKDGKMSKSDEQIESESRTKQKAATRKALPPSSGRGGGVADWASASPELIHRLVCRVGTEGGAVRLGYTRDGGAYSIGIYLGSDSKTYYCNEKEGIDDKIRELTEFFEK
jgi:hypothetical protein